MTVFENIMNRFGFRSEKQFNQHLSEAIKSEIDKKLPRWLGETADAQKYSIPDPSIYATQADMYRLSPILGTAVSILGNDIGTSKLNVKRMVGEEERDIPNHDFELLIRTPNPVDSGIEFLQNTVSNYLLNGNSIWWLNKADSLSVPDEIWPIPFSMISPVPDRQMYIDHYAYYPGNGKTEIRLETWEIVHFKTYNPNNRFVGLSPLESLAVTLVGDQAMRRVNTETYGKHNGVPPSILTFKEHVNDPSWNDMKREIRDSAKRNEMMMLRGVGDGVSWLQRAMSNKDAEYIAGLKQNMTDVFNRMCPGLLSMLSDNATEANALAARATYSEKTQWPIMEVIAQKITTDIMPAYGRKLKAVFDDPRVVDKKLKLEEQTAFERSHTLLEVRKEYYQDEPLGDERDNLLTSQINAQSGGIQEPPAPKVINNAPANQPMNTQSTETQVQSTSSQVDNSTAPIKADLMRWKRYALRTFGKASFNKPFESDVIPEGMARNIFLRLTGCKSVREVADVFEGVKIVNPIPEKDAMAVLRGIELGVMALEQNGRT